MNKQEAIESIKKISDDLLEVKFVSLESVIDIVSQIHEPQKPVVPKFVAEWYEKYKNDIDRAIYNTIIGTYRKLDGVNNVSLGTFEGWFICEDNSILTLVKMYLFGYEIEQEKLYTVEIPNPNLNAHVVLQKTADGLVLVTVGNAGWVEWESSKLTESEIKQDFEWAFQFSKPVEEN